MSDALEKRQHADFVATELKVHLDKQLALCDALEEVADTLPEHIDTQKCLRIAMSIVPLIHEAHRFEEEILFDTLRAAKTADHEFLSHVFERLHSEHFEDQSYGEEVSENLRELANGTVTNFEKIGYMLRGFFEGLRRHIAYEQDVLMPILQPSTRTVK